MCNAPAGTKNHYFGRRYNETRPSRARQPRGFNRCGKATKIGSFARADAPLDALAHLGAAEVLVPSDHPAHHGGAEARIQGARPVLAGVVASAGHRYQRSAGRPHLHRPSIDLRRLKVGGNPLKMPRILQHIE